MSKLQLILLGRFECLLSAGTRISLSMRKAEVLLAYLALTPGLRHPRERLINLLWSDRGEAQARNSLRQCLSSIRKSLGDVAELLLLVDRTTVSLAPGLVDVDVHEFERLAAVGDYEALSTATELYQGEFLEGITLRDPAGQDWLDNERARFKRQFLEILSNLAETQLVSHDFAHAIKSGERLVEQDPLGESGWRLLMRAYADHGDRGHALQAFKRCQKLLRDELEVDPEPTTAELRDRIAGGAARGASAPVAMSDPRLTDAEEKPASRSAVSTDHSVAVLPFDNLSGDPEQEYFSDGITDSIILNLSLFPGLIVKSRNSSFAFKQQLNSLGEISRALGVDYIVEGSIRKSAERIRITVQLIEAVSANQVWGKRYDSDLSDLFTLEEELSRAIAATVTGQIESDLQRIAIAKGAAGQQAYDLLLSGTYHAYRFTPRDTLVAIEELNQCIAADPTSVRAHVMLYACHSMSYLGRWTEDFRASFRQAQRHIERALELGPESALVQTFYGEFLTFNGAPDQAVHHLDKALAINPNDPDALTVKAMNLQCRGEFETALEIAGQAILLDPHHPWAEWELAGSLYCCGQFEAALETISRFRTSPGFMLVFSVASHIKLGHVERARQALQTFLQDCMDSMLTMPQTADEWLEYISDNYRYPDPQINRDLVDCLLQAGLCDDLAQEAVKTPSIAVLPFENMSGDPEQEYFSDGITSSIILSLGLFHGLAVKSQNSSFAFKGSAKSSEKIAEKLKVNYLVEGSVRKSANRIRIAVQLIECASGNQIWGRQYDAELEDILELEQELSQAIAATLSGRIGHRLQRSAARKPARNLASYDYLLRGLYHFGKFTASDFEIARREIAKCLEIDPENATAHTNLGMIHWVEVLEGWTDNWAESENQARQHFESAIEIDPDHSLAHAYLSEYLFFNGAYEQSEFHANKSIELNPTASEGYVVMADLLGLTRRNDEAVGFADRALQLDPYSVGAGWAAGGVYQGAGQYDKAIKTYRSIPHPPASVHAQIAACYIDMDLPAEARKEMRRYQQLARQQMPNYPSDERSWRALWRRALAYQYEEDFVALFDKLKRAGLCDKLTGNPDTRPSIAVLPFENMSGDPEQEHFSDGITADLIDTLSKFKHLRTVARHSTQAYKAERPSIADISDQQGVRYILEGSVRKNGARIRVNAELIDARGEQILWSERFDRDLDDLFAVQDEITQRIALAMKVQLDDGDMARVRSKGATHIRAWELTMAAVDLQDSYIRQNLLDARALATEATLLDPDYAYAWISLGWTYWQEYYAGLSTSLEVSIAEAEAAVRRAREIDPDYSEAYSLAGMIHLIKHEPGAAVENCLKAVALEPGNAEIQGLTAFAYIFAGDYDTARQYDQNIRRLCPLRANWYFLIEGQIEVASGNLERAAEIYREGLEVEPDSPLCRYFLIDLMMQMGDEAAARHYADEIRGLERTASARGIAHTYSSDPSLRKALSQRLQQFDLI